MSRSVSYPNNSIELLFTECASVYDEDDNFDEDATQWAWEDFLTDFTETTKSLWPNFYGQDRWLGNEDHVVLTDGVVDVGLSEYGDLVSLWIVPCEETDIYEVHNLDDDVRWLVFLAAWRKTFGQLRHVGTFSNGEAVFERV